MFHTSDCKKFKRCQKYFWLSKKEPTPPFSPYVRMDEDLTALACRKLEIKEYFQGVRGDDPQRAMTALEESEWLVSARFEFHQLRVKIPFLHKTDAGWEVYFLYGGHLPKEDEAFSYMLSVWVLENLGLAVNSLSVIHLNPDYIRGKELDPQELFIISDRFYNEAGRPARRLSEAIEKQKIEVQPMLDEMERMLELEEPESVKTNRCTRRNKCVYYERCFPEEKELDPDSILTLVSSQYKNQMAAEGRLKLQDADLDRIEGTRQQFAQIKAAQNGGCYIDYFGLKTWLDGALQYPYCFLDFEWETYAVPQYEGMRSYQVLPFQYSLHILEADGTLTHREFIGVHDCREDFVEKLLQDLPPKGSVIAYNAEGAEKIRLQELAARFPKRAKPLMKIYARMVDLAFPFQAGLFYDTRMRGYYSLKTLLPLFDENLTYQDLDIHQGMDAVVQWRNLDQNNDQSDHQAIRDHLLQYCGLDTYSMIIVMNGLKKKLAEWEVRHQQKEAATAAGKGIEDENF